MPERQTELRPAPRILLIERAESPAPLAPVLEKLGWDVFTAADTRDAVFACEVLTSASATPPVAAIADLATETERHALLEALRRSLPGVPLLIISNDCSADAKLALTQAGAFDVLARPARPEEVVAALTRALRVRPQALDRGRPREATGILGSHGTVADVLKLVAKVAPSSSTVLVLGETGTGKEVVARAVHALSPRRRAPLVAVNCAAIPEPLLESELFGHEKGAFTGAVTRKQGLFEHASGGTLFLDEIGDLPLALQPKLLRALQEREILPVGGDRPITIDARIIAATHHDLAERCREGKFREDLFYRLNVFPIHLPPLRERRSDIPLLADHFLRQLAHDSGARAKTIGPQALDCLVQYRWPGNVRELQSAIERAWLLSESDVIETADLPPEIRNPQWRATPASRVEFHIPDRGFVLEEFERSLIMQAMERSNGVVAAAARLLGVSYRTLQYRLQKYRTGTRRK